MRNGDQLVLTDRLDPHYGLKSRLLQDLADYLNGAATTSQTFVGKRQAFFPDIDSRRAPQKVVGPRVGELRLYLGTHAARMHDILTRSNKANLRSVFSEVTAWPLEGHEPEVTWDGDALVIRANWPTDLQFKDIPLQVADNPNNGWMHPRSGKAVIIGLSHSELVAVALDQAAPHMLIAGITGSGKSWLMRSIAYQLSQDPTAQFVILDGKGAQGLGVLNGIRGQVGPVAVTDEQQVNALCWLMREVSQRNAELGQAALGNGEVSKQPPIYVLFDEFQNLLSSNKDAANLVRMLAQLARSANVHLIFGAQRPREDMWGNTGAKFQFDIRIALKLQGAHGSQMVLGPGQDLRAYDLLGSGDAIVVANMLNVTARIRRVQCCYVPEAQLLARTRNSDGTPKHTPALQQWPDFDAGMFREETRGAQPKPFTYAEAVVAMWSAMHERGCPATMDAMRDVLGYGMGSPRYYERLEPLGEELLTIWQKLQERM